MTAADRTLTPDRDIRDAILDAGGEDAYACYQCGLCMAVCPWSQVGTVVFPVYRTPQAVRFGAILASEDPEQVEREVTAAFRCVGCEACTDRCPHGVRLPDIVRAVRRVLVEFGSYPTELRDTVARVQSAGNPYGEPPESRAAWAADSGLADYGAVSEWLYFACCVAAYDPRARKVARAAVEILKRTNVSVGILGESESCCCEAVRRVGAEDAFQQLSSRNVTAFRDNGVARLVVTSPHCLVTFGKDYTELAGDVEVLHQVQFFHRLLSQEKLSLSRPLGKKVVYHDPCTLGRQSGVYEEPREVLRAIPDLELLEFEHGNRGFSLCCGGGGGGMWLERPKGERLSDIRVGQAHAIGAEVLAVACPYCLQMFEDSVATMGLDLEVRDIAELLAGSLE